MAAEQRLCFRLGASLDQVATAIEEYADGDPVVSLAFAELALLEMAELLVEAQEVVSRLKAGTLTREEARTMIVQEDEL